MASKYYGDLVFSTGEYEKDGETKKRWAKAGAVFRDDETGSMSVKLEAVPVSPDWSGWMRIFVKDGKRSHEPMTQAQALNGGKDVVPDDIDDKPIDLSEIPF